MKWMVLTTVQDTHVVRLVYTGTHDSQSGNDYYKLLAVAATFIFIQ